MTDSESSSSDETDTDSTENTTNGLNPISRDELEAQADRAIEGFDRGLIDILGWLLETETRARIYIQLRSSPGATSEEIAEGTGLYPSTVREELSDLYEDGVVERTKRDQEGAGNKPFEYTAIPPSDLVGNLVNRLQSELNAVVNLDRYLSDDTEDGESTPVKIEVRDEDESE